MRPLLSIHLHRGSVAAIGFLLALTFVITGPVPTATATGGSQLWVATYNGGENYPDRANAMAISPDGTRVYVTGYSGRGGEGTSSFDYLTVAYDTRTGAEIWLGRYDGPGKSSDYATAIAASPDGATVYVTGGSYGVGTYVDYATVAYDAATGAMKWVRRYNSHANGDDVARALAVSQDGARVFVTGEARLSNDDYNYVTVAYEAATGGKIWARQYDIPGNGDDQARALGVSPDGATVFVTGGSFSPAADYDYATVAYDAATGATVWVRRYGGPGYDYADALGVSPDGARVYVTGQSLGSGSSDYATVAYDAVTGDRVWVRRYDGPGNGYDQANALAVSPDGARVFVTGQSTGAKGSDVYATVAYDAVTGVKLWVSRYSGPSYMGDEALAIAASPDGSRVYVTGASWGVGGQWSSEDVATLAYDAVTGTEVWALRYDPPGPGSMEASSIVVSSDGSRLFVAGVSTGSGTEPDDYLTIAYSTG